MRFLSHFGLAGLVLTVAVAFGGQASPSHSAGAVLASNYDPYTHGRTVCPQGAPEGGPECVKLLSRSLRPTA